ncbi:MAG: hypothetical protein AB7Q17_12825 [Phycisphaerae bacterium]
MNLDRVRRAALLLASGGALLQSGCLGSLQNSLDILLAPDALGNALVAPYSVVYPLLQFVVRWLGA